MYEFVWIRVNQWSCLVLDSHMNFSKIGQSNVNSLLIKRRFVVNQEYLGAATLAESLENQE